MRAHGRAAALTAFRLLPRRARIILVSLASPRFTVGALVIFVRGDELLLLRQRHHSGWSLPGGLLQRGESPHDAVVREVREELGLALDLPSAPTAVLVEGTRIDVVFRADWPYADTAVVPDGMEVLEGRWFARQSLPAISGPTQRALSAVVPLPGVGPADERQPGVTAG